MPRKKAVLTPAAVSEETAAPTPTPDLAVEAAPNPAPKIQAKKAAGASAKPAPVAKKPAREPRAKKVVEVMAELAPAPVEKKPGRRKNAPEPAVVSVAEVAVDENATLATVSVTPAPAKKRAPRKKAEVATAEPAIGPEAEADLLPHAFREVATRPAAPQREERPRRGRPERAPRPEPTPVAAKPVPAVAETVELDDLLGPVTYRTKGGTSVRPVLTRTPEAPKGRLDANQILRDAGFDVDAPTAPAARQVIAPRPAAPVAPPAPKAPPEPPKPAYVVRPEAPQVVMIEGTPTLVKGGRAYPPFVFFGGVTAGKRAETVFGELRQAADAGVHLHSFLIELAVESGGAENAAALAADLLRRAVAADPEAQVLFRVAFAATRGWSERNPDARFRTADGNLAEPSLSDDGFWGVARENLQAFVKSLKALPDAAALVGLHLDRSEWFYMAGEGFDRSPAAERAFRKWCRVRYGGDEVALRASWFDAGARFDDLKIPADPNPGEGEDVFVRSSRRERRVVDYHLFLSDQTVARIVDLAHAVKVSGDGDFLVGVSYGYSLEWSHPASGHLALGKLLRAEEVDYISAPPSYGDRMPGGMGAFPLAVDSLALNGKLFLSEEDYKTSLAGTSDEPDAYNPALGTPQALESVHWRGVGAALAHGGGLQWMDSWGNGWLKTHSVWERAAAVRDLLVKRLGAPPTNPDVAVFLDERALAYLVDEQGFNLLVGQVRESILRAGVSAAFYLLSDLAHRETFPDAKLHIFLNAWDVRPELRSAIKTRLQRDGKVLFWLYAAGQFDAGRDSLERAREITGIGIKPQPFYSKPGTTLVGRRHPLCDAFPGKTVESGAKIDPSYFAIPENATVLGEYTQSGLPSFVLRKFSGDEGDWTSVFLGEPFVTAALIRALADLAGAHVYGHQDDVIHVRAPYLAVHCGAPGPRTVSVPDKSAAYDLVANRWVPTDGGSIRFTAVEGATHVFLTGSRSEIEAVLAVRPEDVLTVGTLPEKIPNIRRDSALFDAPVMALGEIIESGEGDDLADEWFLRTPPVEAAPAAQAVEADERGKRRRRRSGGRGREDVGSGEPPAVNDVELNVMFRERR